MLPDGLQCLLRSGIPGKTNVQSVCGRSGAFLAALPDSACDLWPTGCPDAPWFSCAGCQCKEQSWFPRITAGWWPWLSACCQGQWASPMVSIWAAYRYIMPKGEVGNVCLSVEGSCFLRTLWPPSKSCWNLQHSFESVKMDPACLQSIKKTNKEHNSEWVSLEL